MKSISLTNKALSICWTTQARACSSIPAQTGLSPMNKYIIVTEIEKGILHVELNRPDKMNSLDFGMFDAICKTALDLQKDRTARCVILSGRGKAFCTGLNIKAIASDPLSASKLLKRPAGTAISNMAQDVSYLWRNVPCPVIAVTHGMCFGGGLQIALGADFRFSTPNCKLSVLEAKWGLIPDMAISVTLRELVKIDVAKELAFTGRIISGTEAERIGLVTRCAEDPMQEALSLAKEIVAQSPDSVAYNKVLFNETWNSNSDGDNLALETRLQQELLPSWNQAAASARNFGKYLPYMPRKDPAHHRQQEKLVEKASSKRGLLSMLKFW